MTETLQFRVTNEDGSYKVQSRRGDDGQGLMGHSWTPMATCDSREEVGEAIAEEIEYQERGE